MRRVSGLPIAALAKAADRPCFFDFFERVSGKAPRDQEALRRAFSEQSDHARRRSPQRLLSTRGGSSG